MSRIRFGFRTVRVKTYELNYFGITQEEAESFAVQYDDFDIWNSNKSLIISPPQIEKRVKYFHIMFVPFFPIETHWTVRNKNGVFKINAICEKKVKSTHSKSYGPWYTFLAPILCITALLIFGITDFFSDQIQQYNYSNELTNRRQQLIKELDSIPTPFYLVTTKSFKPRKFIRVDSITKSSLHITNLVYETKDFEFDYNYHKSFSTDNLESTIVSRDSIISLIPRTPVEASYRNESWKLQKIIPVKDLEKPNLKFNFHLEGITINNLGKPLTLVDFENNSSEKDRWSVEINQYIKNNENIEAKYRPTNKSSDHSNLSFIFFDNENFYEYKVQGTYSISSYSTSFVKTSVKIKK